MTKQEIKKALKDIIKDNSNFEEIEDFEGNKLLCHYLGSYMALDPCGKYHHCLSPNGVSKKCERFWVNLENVADELSCWIETGDGDPTDIFLCKNID